MLLTKKQALVLSNVLYHYSVDLEQHTFHYDDVIDIMTELNSYVLSERDEDENVDTCESEEDSEELDDVVSAPLADATIIDGKALNDLPQLTVYGKDKLELECAPEGADKFDVLVNGYTEYEDCSRIRRSSKCVEFWVDDAWREYEVNKFPKEWTKLLKASVVYGLILG